MGSQFAIVCFAKDSLTARVVAGQAWQRIDEMNRILSDYDPESELSTFNYKAGNAGWQVVSKDLYHALDYGKKLAAESNGAFDPTVGPLSRVWRRAFNQSVLPSDSALAAARLLVDYQQLILRGGKEARLNRPGMRVDPGAFVKGWAADEALSILKRAGISRALVDAGGDLALGDPPPGKRGWRIELPGLDANQQPTTKVIERANAGIATSGDAYRYLTVDGVRYSHLVDPKTGMGLTHLSSVTVIARNGLEADAYATALSVMSPEDAFYFSAKKHLPAQWIVREASGLKVRQNPLFAAISSN